MNVGLTLRAKGGRGLAARAGTILSRFGVTPSRMERCLCHYTDLVEGFGARPTLPITACVLARHPAMIRKYVERDVEFAIHGLVHNDHALLSLDQQRASITRAVEIFQKAGVPCVGFRAPYLRANQATSEAVRALGLRYHSSQAVVFPVLPTEVEQGPQSTAYQRALRLYGALDARHVVVRPRNRYGVVDIPVAVPDDEIMVDRLHFNHRAQTTTWLGILEMTHARGELFTVQLHPERIFDMARALRTVLDEARQRRPNIWIARLDEIASWWSRRHHAVLHVEELGPSRHRVHLQAEPEVTLLVRGLPSVQASAWYARDLVAETRSFEVSTTIKPLVGTSARTPGAVRDFLREEGFPTEVSDHRERFGAYLDVPTDHFDEVGLLAEVERAPGPLVRVWRWPGQARSALAVTGDIDSITLQDFAFRAWEGRRAVSAKSGARS